MATTNWADNWEFHIYHGNQAEYIWTRTAIDIRLGWDFMWEIVKKINLSITGAFIHYDTVWESGEKEEKYFAIETSQYCFVPKKYQKDITT